MNDLTKTRREADEAMINARGNSLTLKFLGYLLAFVICGAVICLLIGIFKTAVDTLVIIGAILLIVALFFLWIYNSARAHIKERRYKDLLHKYESGDMK